MWSLDCSRLLTQLYFNFNVKFRSLQHTSIAYLNDSPVCTCLFDSGSWLVYEQRQECQSLSKNLTSCKTRFILTFTCLLLVVADIGSFSHVRLGCLHINCLFCLLFAFVSPFSVWTCSFSWLLLHRRASGCFYGGEPVAGWLCPVSSHPVVHSNQDCSAASGMSNVTAKCGPRKEQCGWLSWSRKKNGVDKQVRMHYNVCVLENALKELPIGQSGCAQLWNRKKSI